MYKNQKIFAIIPCRSGSKGLKNKNIRKIFNKHLVYYTIFFAKKCKFIDEIFLSTDSIQYSKISKKYNLNVPFLRPKSISKDNSLDIEFIKHAIKVYWRHYNFSPDIVIILRPTSPLRKIQTLKKALDLLIENKKSDSVRSISQLSKSIYKTWTLEKGSIIKPTIKNDTKFIEPYNAPRQKLKKFYYSNGSYDLFRSKLLKKNKISGNNIIGIETKDPLDIDTYNDLNKLKKFKKELLNFKKYIGS